MDDRPSVIPAELRSDLEALRPVLERQGVVQFQSGSDRLGSYRLRYREFCKSAGYTLHRSRSLGSDSMVAEAVAALIQLWQDQFQAGKEAAEPRPAAMKGEVSPVDPARDLAQALCGGGWRRQKQIAEWYDKALQDPAEMMRFAFSGKFPAARKAGRSPKKRLW